MSGQADISLSGIDAGRSPATLSLMPSRHRGGAICCRSCFCSAPGVITGASGSSGSGSGGRGTSDTSAPACRCRCRRWRRRCCRRCWSNSLSAHWRAPVQSRLWPTRDGRTLMGRRLQRIRQIKSLLTSVVPNRFFLIHLMGDISEKCRPSMKTWKVDGHRGAICSEVDRGRPPRGHSDVPVSQGMPVILIFRDADLQPMQLEIPSASIVQNEFANGLKLVI